MKFWTAPQITIVAFNTFGLPDHLPVDYPEQNDASEPELLAEYAGRICYMSQANPAQRTTSEYLTNILSQQHGSVLEHASFSFLIEGVSRALTHELIRHRAGTAVSQLSQRYVDASDTDFVVPPAVQRDLYLQQAFELSCRHAAAQYESFCAKLEALYSHEPSKVLRRKRAREAARAILPNATETKLIWTANIRALRHILELRGSAHADLEIQQFARQLYELVVQHAPSCFADFVVQDDGSLTCQFHKV